MRELTAPGLKESLLQATEIDSVFLEEGTLWVISVYSILCQCHPQIEESLNKALLEYESVDKVRVNFSTRIASGSAQQ